MPFENDLWHIGSYRGDSLAPAQLGRFRPHNRTHQIQDAQPGQPQYVGRLRRPILASRQLSNKIRSTTSRHSGKKISLARKFLPLSAEENA